MILDEIKALLAGNAGVQTVLSNPARVYAGTVLPRGYALPGALIHTVTTGTDYTFQGTTGFREMTIQLDIYADTEAGAVSVLQAVRVVLKNFKGILSGGSVVLATIWKTDADMPFSADINKVALGYRVMSSICFYYIEASS